MAYKVIISDEVSQAIDSIHDYFISHSVPSYCLGLTVRCI